MKLDNPFARFGFVLLAAAVATGAMMLPAGARLAVVPVALVFGWSQIGGL